MSQAVKATTKPTRSTRSAASKTAAGGASPLKVLFTVSEVAPFITTGGMGQVVGALPAALLKAGRGLDVRVVSPLYASVRQRFADKLEFVGGTEVALAWRRQYCGVYRATLGKVTYYFVDNEQYFDRNGCYGHFDDGERFAFLSKAVFAVMEMTGFVPDIVHAHDWQTALVPIYLKTQYADRYSSMRAVFTIHNMEYQGRFPMDILGDVFDIPDFDRGLVEFDGSINLMKGAIITCDRLTTVSPSYKDEIQIDEGFGLEPIIRENAYKLRGITNGIDTTLHDPATDSSLARNYTAETLEDKAVNKREVQTLFGLPAAPRKMLICVVSRLVPHKGIDLLTYMLEDLLALDVQFLLLGTGNHDYELFFTEMAMRHPTQVGVNIAFNPEIASKVYAGADIMLMPSRSEPCGLAQMIACRYGTIPIVRATGGLKDTIRDCRGGVGNGYVFDEYSAHALFDTIRQAHDLYTYHEDDWRNLMREAMRSDFEWKLSAKAYLALYRELV